MTISIPKPGTGIKQSLLTTYSLEDQAWSDPSDPNHLKFSHLARNCVLVGDGYFVRDKLTKHWCPVSKSGVTPKLLSERGGTIQLNGFTHAITKDDITNFLRHGIVSFSATTYAPGAGDFVIFEHQKRLNLYRDQRLAGDTDNLPYTEEFLKVIRNSLCAEPDEIGFEEMVAEIWGDTPTLFKWVLHWLAARYQRPGYAPQTNVWFIGPLRGVGKGTLVSAIKGVLGGKAVGKANQLDIQKGWTNSLFGHELVEWDEFKAPGGWIETSNLIKAMTGNETIQINARNVGGSTHPAVAMHVFSTNDEKPMRVEEWDRQNTFVATTDDPAWAARAKALWDEETREFHEARLVDGFAALLNEIEVDYKLICRPFMTEKRTELRDAFGCSVGKWFRTADLEHLRGDLLELEDLHRRYRDWVKDHLHGRPEDIDEFKRKMVNGGWMKAATTTVGSRSDGTRRSIRGFRLLSEDQETEGENSGTDEATEPQLANASFSKEDQQVASDNLIILPTKALLKVEANQAENVAGDDVVAVDQPERPSIEKLMAKIARMRRINDR